MVRKAWWIAALAVVLANAVLRAAAPQLAVDEHHADPSHLCSAVARDRDHAGGLVVLEELDVVLGKPHRGKGTLTDGGA